MALVPRRSRGATGSQRLLARLLHPLFRPGGNDRTGRHGEMELSTTGEPRDPRPTLPLFLLYGARHFNREFRMGRAADPGPGDRHYESPIERRADAQPLPP